MVTADAHSGLVAAIGSALPGVIFAGVLALLGLACDHDRRAYALAYADRFVDLAAVLLGRSRGPSRRVTGAGATTRAES